MHWQVGFAVKARIDLTNIVSFVALENIFAARTLASKLIELAFSLEHMPYRGVLVSKNLEPEAWWTMVADQ